MIDSAITPEPIVATVRFERGDMSASIGAVGGRRRVVSRGIGLSRLDGKRRPAADDRPGRTRAGRSREEGDRPLDLVLPVEEREEELGRMLCSSSE
jgi:hypothetical protein